MTQILQKHYSPRGAEVLLLMVDWTFSVADGVATAEVDESPVVDEAVPGVREESRVPSRSGAVEVAAEVDAKVFTLSVAAARVSTSRRAVSEREF